MSCREFWSCSASVSLRAGLSQRQQRFTPHCRLELPGKNPACCAWDKANIFSACVPAANLAHSECEFCAEVLCPLRGSGILFCVWQQQLLARLDFASNHSFGLGKLNNTAEESGRRGITFLWSCSAFYV